MKYISALSLALCTYSVCICMEEITISNGTDTFKRQIKATMISPEKVNLQEINVYNQTDWRIEARVEGFGVKDINSEKLEDWKLYTGGADILPGNKRQFTVLTSAIQFPIKTTLFRLYAHALIVKYVNDKNSEIHFSEPLNAPSNDFVVTSYRTNQGSRLKIENKIE